MRKAVLAVVLVLVMGLGSLPTPSASATPARSVSGAAIVQTALRYLGYAYTTVGNSPGTGFSCIGFVSYVYNVNGIPLPGNLWSAMAFAPSVAFSNLLPGDVLWFQNTVWPGVSHTAIYLGGGRFVHAEWYNRGVVTSSFVNDPIDFNYWSDHYLGASRPWGGVTTIAPPVRSVPAAPAPTSAPPAPAPPPLREGPRARVQVEGVNIRVRPSLFGPIRQLVTQGTSVVVLKQYRTWDWVQLPNRSYGWVTGNAIGLGFRSAHRLAMSPLALMRSPAAGIPVRMRPGPAAPVVASTSPGQRLLILKRWHRWLRIAMPDGTRGWMRNGIIRMSRPWANHSRYSLRRNVRHRAFARTHRGGPVITAGVRVRTRPGVRAPVLGLAAPGTHVQILGTWRQWDHVRFPGGRIAWVYRAYVHQ